MTSTENTPVVITLTDAASKMIKADVTAFKRDTKRYAEYVTEMDVTADTVAAHVALFRDAFKAAHPASRPADGAAVKAYATKVRNGLNYHVAKGEPADTVSPDLLAIILKAVDKGVDGGLDAAAIRAAVAAHVDTLLS